MRQVLGLSGSQEIKNNEPWTDLGVDSLMMVEIKNRLEGSLHLTFPIELLMRDVSIQSVTEFVLDKLARRGGGVGKGCAHPIAHTGS